MLVFVRFLVMLVAHISSKFGILDGVSRQKAISLGIVRCFDAILVISHRGSVSLCDFFKP